MTLSLVLNRIIWHTPARVGTREITVAEAAAAAGVHERTLYRALEGDGTLRADNVRALSHYLAVTYRDTRLAEWMLPELWTVVPLSGCTDGRIDDDVQGIVTATGDAITSYASDPARAAQAADHVMQSAATLKAECTRKLQ